MPETETACGCPRRHAGCWKDNCTESKTESRGKSQADMRKHPRKYRMEPTVGAESVHRVNCRVWSEWPQSGQQVQHH